MYPGQTTRLSRSNVATALSIDVGTDLVRLTGTTSIATINQKNLNKGTFAQILFLLPLDGNVGLTAAGNIVAGAGITLLQNKVSTLIWDPVTAKWYTHALS